MPRSNRPATASRPVISSSSTRRPSSMSSSSWRDFLDQTNEYFTEKDAYGNSHHHSRNSSNRGSHHSTHRRSSNYHRSYQAPPMTKEQWVLANYSFLIRPPSQVNNSNESLLRQSENDPDCLIEWKAVEIVRYKTESVETCPICLDEFRAPRTTKCGHVYCYSCILRYLNDSEYTHRKCPMCNESVHESQLKPVQFESIAKVEKNHEVDMLLMKRSKNSLVIYPASHDTPPMSVVHPILSEPDAAFNRYCVTYDIGGLLQSEMDLLQREAAKNADDILEVAYLDRARENVALQLAMWNDWVHTNLPYGNPSYSEKERQRHNERFHPHGEENGTEVAPLSAVSGAEEAFGSDDEGGSSTDNKSHASSDVESTSTTSTTTTQHTLAQRHRHQQQKKRPKKQADFEDDEGAKDFYFFYQSSDGNSVYLDHLCSRILATEHGGYSKVPLTLHTNVTNIERLKVDDEARRRHVFAKHLPHNAEVTIVEVDTKPLVSERTYAQFESEINRRLTNRRAAIFREKKNEERAKKRAAEEEERRRQEMEREKFLWRDTDFPKVDEYGREIVPGAEDFVPLTQNVHAEAEGGDRRQNAKKKDHRVPNQKSQWSRHVHPSLASGDSFGPSLSSNTTAQQQQTTTVWGAPQPTSTNNGDAFPSLSAAKGKGGGRRR